MEKPLMEKYRDEGGKGLGLSEFVDVVSRKRIQLLWPFFDALIIATV